MVLLSLAVTGSHRALGQSEPLRILSFSTAASHILLALGHPPVAIDQYGRIACPDEAIPVIARGGTVSFEKVVELGVNQVLIWYYQDDLERLFRRRGIAVSVLPPLRLHNYASLLGELGKLTGKEQRAELLQAQFSDALDSLQAAAVEVLTPCYFELYSDWKAAGQESYIGDLLRVAGASCPEAKTALLSAERVLAFAPQIIFYVDGFGSKKELLSRPGLASSPAAKNGRVYAVDRRYVSEGLDILAAIEFFRSKLAEAR